jgi:phosphoglycerol transferase
MKLDFNKIKNLLPFILSAFLPVILAILLLKIDLKNFDKPIFSYSSDSVFNLFIVKSIIDNGLTFSNQFVGLPHISEVFHINDFAVQSDLFNLMVIKFFTFFTSNPFLIINLFYLLTYSLVGFFSFVAFKGFKISNRSALIFCVLFAFIPYHQVRSVWHIFLSNYAVAGLTILVSYWIVEKKLKLIGIDEKNRYSFQPNKYFFLSFLITIFAAISGVYYTYYFCIILFFAVLLNLIRSEKLFDKNLHENSNFSAFFLIFLTLAILTSLYLPTYLYQISHGKNIAVGNRSAIQSEYYALRLIDMILPIKNHFINYFSNLRNFFDLSVASEGERESSTLGFVASIGFIFSILWLIKNSFLHQKSSLKNSFSEFNFTKNEQDRISILANLNLLSLLFALVGGLVMIISINMPLIRSHARFSIYIAFISFTVLAILFDKFLEKEIKYKKIIQPILIILVLMIGIFDQVGDQKNQIEQAKKNLIAFENDKKFVEEIEEKYPQSSIFILPVTLFPEADDFSVLNPYLHSQKLKFSSPAMLNRESSNWQRRVSSIELEEFLSEIKKAGFSGIIINKKLFFEKKSVLDFVDLKNFLLQKKASDSIISDNKNLIFFKI